MPEARLQRTRETLPTDGSYQFGHGAFGVMRCSVCGEYGHAWCGIVGREVLVDPFCPLREQAARQSRFQT